MKNIFFVFVLVGIILHGSSSACAIQVAADLDKTSVQVQEEMRLTIRISDAQGNVQAPRIQGLDGFDIFYTGRSSHLSFINGQSSSSVEFSYVLIPQREGQFTIQPIDIQAGGQNFKTEPITVQVTPASQTQQPSPRSGWTTPSQPGNPFANPFAQSSQSSRTPSSQQQPANEPAPEYAPEDDSIYILARVNKTKAYPNEQILLTYSLYTQHDTRYEGFQDEPEVSGFWIEEFPMDQNIPKETVRVNGKRYIKADVKKYALFPTAPADYTIKPGVLKASIRRGPQRNSVFDEFFDDSFFSGGGFFSQRENLLIKPQPIHLQIIPFPEQGKPKSFQGAVGNFRLSASADKTAVKQDEPVTLTLIMEGEGNIETLNKPLIPEVENFRTYDADAKHQLFRTGDLIGGRKTFEIVFIPTQPGRQVIPSLEFSYFDPASQSYKILKTPEFQLQVSKSDQSFALPAPLAQSDSLKKDVEVLKKDIRSIQEVRLGEEKRKKITVFINGTGAVNIVLSLLIVVSYVSRRRGEFYNQNKALHRRSQAKTRAESKLKKLAALMRNPSSEADAQYFDEVERILTQYLTDKFNLSTHGTTKADMERKLSEVLGSADPLFENIMGVYASCDISRFAKAAVGVEAKQKAFQTLRETIQKLERV